MIICEHALMQRFFKRIASSAWVIVMVMLAACSPQAPNIAPVTTEIMTNATQPDSAGASTAIAQNVTQTPSVALTETAPTETPVAQLSVWWSEPLAPLDNELAAELLSEQLSAFQRDNPNINVNFRLKQVGDVGGIMSTLRASTVVAPGALPDLTLLRRSDLLQAVEAGLIYPFDTALNAAIMEDLHPSGLNLGRIDGVLYGVPYTLDLEHVAYAFDAPPEHWTFDALLEAEMPFTFPAGQPNGISDVFLLQYLAGGGAWTHADSATIHEEALLAALDFYDLAAENALITPDVLEYATPNDYRRILSKNMDRAAVVTSNLYLQLADQGIDLDFAPIPTADGTALTIVDGWMWVLTTQDANRQARAIRFLNSIMDSDRHFEYTSAIQMLPSQRSALRQLPNQAYVAFVNRLLENAVLPLSPAESGTTARAMQNALAAIINGQLDPETAVRNVIEMAVG